MRQKLLSGSNVVCGSSMTVALTTSGHVYMMGGPESDGDFPLCVEGLKDDHIKEIACGSHHVAALNSRLEVYTWGKGTNGQLGISRTKVCALECLK